MVPLARSAPRASALPIFLAASLFVFVFTPGYCRTVEAPMETFDRALAFHQEGRLDEALDAYRRSAPALERIDPEAAGAARNNACAILNDRGDFRAARVECAEAVRLRQLLNDPVLLARALNNRGRTLQSLGQSAPAEADFRAALALNRKAGDVEGAAINLANLGVAATEAGRYGSALEAYAEGAALAARHAAEPWAADQLRIARVNEAVVLEKLGAYEEALALYRDLLAREGDLDPGLRASIVANVGVLYRNLGDPRRALAAFAEAAALYDRAGDRAGAANVSLNLGIVRHLNLGDREGALKDFRAGLALARESGDRTEEIQDLFYLGRLLFEEGRLDEAERVFSECLARAASSGSAEGRWSAREGLGRIAAARGDLPAAREHLARALAEIEATRAEIGSRRLEASYFGDRRPAFETAVAIEARSALAGDREGAGRALALAERAKARELIDALGGSALLSEPLAAAKALDVSALVRAGSARRPVIELFVAEGRLYLWRLDGREAALFDLGPSAPPTALVRRVHRDLSAGRAPATADLSALARTLLGPLGALGTLDGVEALRIAPDGELRYLPFELLPLPGGSGEPLISRVTVSYLPSTAAALALAGRPGDATSSFLGKRATEAAFRAESARGARVLHFATHAILDERTGRGGAILLTPAGDDDGLLDPAEIAARPVRSDLAVLSACSTALGGASPGRGAGALSTLSGAFLAAGVSGVVASLWDVGDQATAAFMGQFYAQLARGLPPAEALARTKRRLLATPGWNRPEVWSAFVLIGEPPAVASPRLARFLPGPGGGWLWAALAGMALAGAAVSAARRRSRRASKG